MWKYASGKILFPEIAKTGRANRPVAYMGAGWKCPPLQPIRENQKIHPDQSTARLKESGSEVSAPRRLIRDDRRAYVDINIDQARAKPQP